MADLQTSKPNTPRDIALVAMRWIVLLPVVVALFIGLEAFMLAYGVPLLRSQIIEDPSNGYEVSSHLFWLWLLRPLALVFVGLTPAGLALTAGVAIAPSHTTPSIIYLT
jgi:hypothetical protein